MHQQLLTVSLLIAWFLWSEKVRENSEGHGKSGILKVPGRKS